MWKKKSGGTIVTDTSANLISLLNTMGVLAYDSFNRVDNAAALGTADTGQTWTVLQGTWGISSNQACLITSAGARNRIVINGLPANVSITITFSVNTVLSRLMFRHVDTSNYLQFINLSGSSYALYKVVAGVATMLGSFATTPANGDVLNVTLNGSSIIAKLNGAQVISVTETFNQTATQHGFTTDNDTIFRMDNFKVEAV